MREQKRTWDVAHTSEGLRGRNYIIYIIKQCHVCVILTNHSTVSQYSLYDILLQYFHCLQGDTKVMFFGLCTYKSY